MKNQKILLDGWPFDVDSQVADEAFKLFDQKVKPSRVQEILHISQRQVVLLMLEWSENENLWEDNL